MSTRQIFREIGVLLIGFMIYDSLYRPWSPLAARFVPGLAGADGFTFARAVAILLVCIAIYVVFWFYDFAVRLRKVIQNDINEDRDYGSMFKGGVWAAYPSEDDEEFEIEHKIVMETLTGTVRGAVVIYGFLQYFASVVGLSLFAWLAMGQRQAFCVFVGTICILDIRKIWSSPAEKQA